MSMRCVHHTVLSIWNENDFKSLFQDENIHDLSGKLQTHLEIFVKVKSDLAAEMVMLYPHVLYVARGSPKKVI